jgi:hypothetical protein
VLVAVSNFRGAERGERIAAVARIVEEPRLDELVLAKYGWQKRLLNLVNRNRSSGLWVALEIVDA